MSKTGNSSQTRAEFIRQFLPTSPYVGHLAIQLIDMQRDVATLKLPFADHSKALTKIDQEAILRTKKNACSLFS